MARIVTVLSTALLLLAACQTSGRDQASTVPPADFAGGVLRVEYPTRGNQDILIFVNPDGSVSTVRGGASSVLLFRLTQQRLSFTTTATTDWGQRPMNFDLVATSRGYAGQYRITSRCQNNCVRNGTARWESGAENVQVPSG